MQKPIHEAIQDHSEVIGTIEITESDRAMYEVFVRSHKFNDAIEAAIETLTEITNIADFNADKHLVTAKAKIDQAIKHLTRFQLIAYIKEREDDQ